ncbi:MAG: glycoside hydrolase family 3 C-terminal domain-containing protein [Pyrinomonadaceae bacterium]|nr:glycoside hydrolase family 3 C-terminal domain-containing protein [Pyrinomonadaceae bacterium]
MKTSFLLIFAILFNSLALDTTAQTTKDSPGKKIYFDGWNDLNKNGKKDVYEDSKADINARIENLLAQMTLEEKTNQTATLYGYNRVLKDALPTPEWKNAIWKDGIANIDEQNNGWDSKDLNNPYAIDVKKHVWAMNEVQRFFIEETRLGIPVDFTNEGIRGVAFTTGTSFPSQLALANTWNKNLIREVGRITGAEARALGYTNIYAPIMDMGRDQRWGRYEDTYGEDPYLAGTLGVEMVKGLQEKYQVAATAKHFAIHGVNKGAREGDARVDPQISPREAEYIFVRPFGKVVKEGGLLGVMASYNDYDGVPIISSKYWLIDRLRKEFNFKGYVVSDSGAVEDLSEKHKTALDAKDAVYQSIEGGLNVKTHFRIPETFILPLRELVKEGKVSMKTLDDRVRDVLRVKFLLGLFDHPYIKDANETEKIVNSAEHQKIADQAAHESIVLLKNDKNILPLDKNIKSIAVIGPNADNKSNLTYRYGISRPENGITALQGIKNKLGEKVTINYAKGCNVTSENWANEEILPTPLTETEKSEIEKAVEAARKSDVAVVFLGDQTDAFQRPEPLTVGESASRTNLDLPGRQLDLIKAVYAVGKPTIVVLINGRPMSINWVDKYVPGIIETWFPGGHGGTAIADVLFGDYNPSGKLTSTFPKSAGQIPFNFPSKPNAQWEKEKSRVNGALYYFGHGLSYTTFAYSNLKITPEKQTPNGNITVSFDVKNTGSREGTEIVQLYTRDVVSSVITYEKNLRGFERVQLKPNETKTVTFTLKPEDLEMLDINMKWIVEPGMFKVMIGSSSEDIRLNGEFEIISK